MSLQGPSLDGGAALERPVVQVRLVSPSQLPMLPWYTAWSWFGTTESLQGRSQVRMTLPAPTPPPWPRIIQVLEGLVNRVKLAELLHNRGEFLDHEIDFRFRRAASDAEPDRRRGHVGFAHESRKYVRGFSCR